MAELNGVNVEDYTNGRLAASDPEVLRMLDVALSVARRECKWHVSPVRYDVTMTLDGPDSRILWLPTMKVDELSDISENGTALDVANVSISVGNGPEDRRPAAARKSGGAFWTAEYGAIELTMSHGFAEAEAEDWRQAILSMVDQMSLLPIKASTGASAFDVKSMRIDDVAYTYDTYAAMAQEVLFSVGHVIAGYRLPDLEFM